MIILKYIMLLVERGDYCTELRRLSNNNSRAKVSRRSLDIGD